MKTETKLNLYQKLLEIQKEVKGLKKDKKSNNYEYVTGNKLLSFIKPLMDKYSLLLKQEIISIDNERMDYRTGIGTQYEKDKSEILSKVMMQFTWIDCESGEKDVNSFGANGQNDWEKGLGSALTYAERYFILKYFHIATDEDDIDNPDRKPEDKQEKQPKQNPQTTDAKSEPTNWLNDVDKQGNETQQWANLKAAIAAKQVTSVAEVRKYYKISKEIAAKLEALING
jgi:hypothetical protein